MFPKPQTAPSDAPVLWNARAQEGDSYPELSSLCDVMLEVHHDRESLIFPAGQPQCVLIPLGIKIHSVDVPFHIPS